MKPLTEIEKGQSVYIESFAMAKDLRKRLKHLGLFKYKLLWVKAKFSDGRMVMGDDCFRVAIDAEIAKQIFVKVFEL
jgi:Fe2+ transport system protein FeoA